MKQEDFLLEWFGVEGRELGTPERFFTTDPYSLIRRIETCRQTLSPLYVSVQPYRARDQPSALEKLFFDFDCAADPGKAWLEAREFALTLKRFYGAEPFVTYSGGKGFHVYVFLEKAVEFVAGQVELARKVLEELQRRLLLGFKAETLDHSPIGDIKRLARAPFSFHEKTGSLCCPVDSERKPIIPDGLDTYRTLDAKLISPIIKEMKLKEETAPSKFKKIPKMTKRQVRPCIEAALNKPLEGKAGHLMRLAIATEFLNNNCTVEKVISLFQGQADFSPQRCRYFVEHAKNRGYKPFQCRTIRELGFCLTVCPVRRKMQARG